MVGLKSDCAGMISAALFIGWTSESRSRHSSSLMELISGKTISAIQASSLSRSSGETPKTSITCLPMMMSSSVKLS